MHLLAILLQLVWWIYGNNPKIIGLKAPGSPRGAHWVVPMVIKATIMVQIKVRHFMRPENHKDVRPSAFVKYESSLPCEWNLHENDRVVVILEQFEVPNSKTVPPLHFQKMSPTHRGWTEGLEGSDQKTVKIILKFISFGGHLCRNRCKEIGWKCL